MKKTIFSILTLFTLLATLFSCSDSETYAEMKEKEKKAIQTFIQDNDFVGPITVISESQFYANDTITDTAKNEFVLFDDDGIYMQIVRKGEGQTMKEMAMEQPDSTITKNILCRFLEYDIEDADTTVSNLFAASIVDKMLVKYSQYSQSFTASYTEGYMLTKYSSSVPTGWMTPLKFIRLSKNAGKIAKIRMIVPHSSGTSNASGYVLPMYYDITYQLGR